MVFNTTFNNISVILWRSVLKMEETGENHRPGTTHWNNVVLVVSTTHWKPLYHNVVLVVSTTHWKPL
jgi:hypothetical protein